jgi:hypothetical protein
MAVSLSAFRTGHDLPPEISLVPISVTDWVNTRVMVWPEGLGKLSKYNDLIGNPTRDLPANRYLFIVACVAVDKLALQLSVETSTKTSSAKFAR